MIKIVLIANIEKLGVMFLFKAFSASLFMTFSFLLMGCSSHSNKEATPALFNTKAEAVKAAKKFNCKGAHQMGDKWMPCDSHDIHEKGEKHGKHSGHKHHH